MWNFFEYQLVVGFIEAVILFLFFYRELPLTVNKARLIYFDWEAVKRVAPFSVGVAYTAGIWILITQTDKLVLSTVLTLSEFGYFSLIGLIAGAITMLSGPIAQAIMPRLTILIAQNKKSEMLNIYSLGSQITVLFSFSLALMIGLYAEPLIFAWTGEVEPAKWGANILIWFALGNGVLSVGAFQYYLQSAFGQLRLHVLGSTISAVIQVPLIYYAATEYGAIGAGMAWFGFRCIWFLAWTPVVHRQFVPGFHIKWLFQDILPIIVTVVIVAFMLYVNFGLTVRQNRMVLLIQMLTLGVSLVAISSLSVSVVRKIIIEKLISIFRLNNGSS
jgi:O-antigen/teichoic acid export membrane protein